MAALRYACVRKRMAWQVERQGAEDEADEREHESARAGASGGVMYETIVLRPADHA
jgi:hypothetical protein